MKMNVQERKFFVIGNWKMNTNFQQIKNNLSFLGTGDLDTATTEVVIAPSAPYLYFVKENLKEIAPNVEIALQNCHTHTAGSFTGKNDKIFFVFCFLFIEKYILDLSLIHI